MKSITATQEGMSATQSNKRSPATSTPISWGIACAKRLQPMGQALFLLAVRLLFGALFVQTGWRKLMNFEMTANFFDGLGLPAPATMVVLVGVTELVGGILLIVGAGARVASAVLVVVMVVALVTAHSDAAFAGISSFIEQAPFPFLTASFIVFSFGAGRFSVEGFLRSLTRRSKQPAKASEATLGSDRS